MMELSPTSLRNMLESQARYGTLYEWTFCDAEQGIDAWWVGEDGVNRVSHLESLASHPWHCAIPIAREIAESKNTQTFLFIKHCINDKEALHHCIGENLRH